MKSALRLRPEAEADLREAYRWYEQQRIGLGEDFLLCVEASSVALRENPEQFPKVYQEVRRMVLRRFPYSILYLTSHDEIVVLAIFHGRRDPQTWRKRIGKRGD